MLNRGPVLGLNHVLGQQAWARERLAPFAGHIVEFRLVPLPDLRLLIRPDGLLDQAAAGVAPHLTVNIRPSALPYALLRDEALLREIDITGSPELAQVVQQLFRDLEWDVEEDLSRLFGDVLAHRMARAGRDLLAGQREAGLRVAQNLAEYWTEENPLIARRADLAQFSADVERLRDHTERLDKRIDRLAQRVPR